MRKNCGNMGTYGNFGRKHGNKDSPWETLIIPRNRINRFSSLFLWFSKGFGTTLTLWLETLLMYVLYMSTEFRRFPSKLSFHFFIQAISIQLTHSTNNKWRYANHLWHPRTLPYLMLYKLKAGRIGSALIVHAKSSCQHNVFLPQWWVRRSVK